MSELRPGVLLVAAPGLLDPSFADAVVLILDHDHQGAMGVVLNRPSPMPVAEVLGDWCEVVTDPEVLYRGGPVGTNGALGLGRLARPAEEPVGWRPVYADIGIVDLDTPVQLLDGSLGAMRIFAGYAGWGAGQLKGEIDRGSWYVVASEPDDPFGDATAELRREVLRRQPGELAWISTRPADPALN
jgi:putative transcriptional regulator